MSKDPYRGKRVRDCPWCDDDRFRSRENCDRCGGTGRIRECKRGDCAEYGCGGYGTCYEPRDKERSAA